MSLEPKIFPHFENPPLNEVVLGVQFRPAQNYQEIQAFEVWNLFRDQFPLVQESMPIPPQFETFGLPSAPQIGFNMMSGAIHNRFWFLSKQSEQLIQFQQDRLLHNWRKVGDRSNEYPRFENIVDQFAKEVEALEGYFKSLGNERLFVTQVEVSYINHIRMDELMGPVRLQKWLTFINPEAQAVDEFVSNTRSILKDDSGRPYARLYRDSALGLTDTGARILMFTLSVRGKPELDNLQETLKFISKGREVIADDFIRNTTVDAQAEWKRVQ